jgi:hypothetical protein
MHGAVCRILQALLFAPISMYNSTKRFTHLATLYAAQPSDAGKNIFANGCIHYSFLYTAFIVI